MLVPSNVSPRPLLEPEEVKTTWAVPLLAPEVEVLVSVRLTLVEEEPAARLEMDPLPEASGVTEPREALRPSENSLTGALLLTSRLVEVKAVPTCVLPRFTVLTALELVMLTVLVELLPMSEPEA